MTDPRRAALARLRDADVLGKMRAVIEAVRAVGAAGHWDAPHWTLHVPAREINALFDLAYELDPTLAALDAALRAPSPAPQMTDDVKAALLLARQALSWPARDAGRELGWREAQAIDAIDTVLTGPGPERPHPADLHKAADDYARQQVVPLYQGGETPTPYERGMIRIVAAAFLAGAFTSRPQPPVDLWQPIHTAPRDEEVFFWVVPRTKDDAYYDSAGQPIITRAGARLHRGRWRTWSGLETATHWRPLPSQPPADPQETP